MTDDATLCKIKPISAWALHYKHISDVHTPPMPLSSYDIRIFINEMLSPRADTLTTIASDHDLL